MKLDPKIKERWLVALRSGNYNQVQSILSDGHGGFCCLGVLCEIAVADGIIESKAADYDTAISYYDPESSFDRDKSTLPYKVADWAGLEGNKNPSIFITLDDIPEEYHEEVMVNIVNSDILDFQASLAALNDSGIPFSVIADLIEKYL